MSADYITISATFPYKLAQMVDKHKQIFGLSRANTVVKLVEMGLLQAGEQNLDRTTTSLEFEPRTGNYPLRKIL